jgi:hypothetical protein
MTQPEHAEGSLVAPSSAARCQAALEQVRALAASAVMPAAFHAQLLRLVVETLGAEAGIVWVPAGESKLNAAAEVRLAETGWRANMALRAWCEPLMRDVLAAGGVRRQSADIGDVNGVARTRHVLLFALQRGAQVAAVVQIFESPGGSEADRLTHLRFVESILVIAGGYYDRVQPAPAPAARQNDLRGLVLALHHSLRFRDVAAAAANDLRLWYAADRVSIAERVGNRVFIRAVSGQEKLNQKANVLKLLTQLAAAVVKSNERLVFEGDPSVVPPSLERRLADYLHEGKSRRLAIVPLVVPEVPGMGRLQAEPLAAGRRPLGAVVIEQFSDAGWPADLLKRVEETAPHLSLALANALWHERVFLMPLLDRLGRWRARLRGKRLATAAVIAAALAGVIAALVFVSADYRVEATGRLMPAERGGVYAPWDSTVARIEVASGQEVRAGQKLLVLRSEELESKLLTARHERGEKLKQISAVTAELAATPAPENELELRGKRAQLQVAAAGLDLQIRLLQSQLEALEVRSPIDGVVATFQIEEILRERPVRRGELLLEVMRTTGPWRLELDVPERRLGHILAAQAALPDSAQLPVRYVLATQTTRTHDAWLLPAATTRSQVAEREGTIVPMQAAPEGGLPVERQIGAELTAKITCGRRALGYVLFGDVIEFLRKRFWF